MEQEKLVESKNGIKTPAILFFSEKKKKKKMEQQKKEKKTESGKSKTVSMNSLSCKTPPLMKKSSKNHERWRFAAGSLFYKKGKNKKKNLKLW